MSQPQHSAASSPLDPYVISLIRTVVPVLWGHIAAWLISLGIPSSVLDSGRSVVVELLAVVLTIGWYALWRWIEVRSARAAGAATILATSLALGHPALPIYPEAASTGTHVLNTPPAA